MFITFHCFTCLLSVPSSRAQSVHNQHWDYQPKKMSESGAPLIFFTNLYFKFYLTLAGKVATLPSLVSGVKWIQYNIKCSSIDAGTCRRLHDGSSSSFALSPISVAQPFPLAPLHPAHQS
jgi:hypothetical protein